LNDPAPQAQSVRPDYQLDDLGKLRSIIVGPEQKDISRLRERLDNPEIRASEISNVLAEAVLIRASKDKKLALALLPTIEDVIRDSVKRDPQFLATAIFPIIGPAIRKAISESIRSMMQSFNEALEYSVSWKGLMWRWESIRTGRPFSEVVLMHTLIYRVEQVFLIHGATGLVIQHVAADDVVVRDEDMVSGMLTAIQDFVKDSFGITEGQALQSMHVGDLTIWIEKGACTVLAAVIRGNPPEDLRIVLEEAIEKIEFEQRQALTSFKGDSAPFLVIRPHLESCLLQARGKGRKEALAATDRPLEKVEKAGKKGVKSNPQLVIIVAGILCLIIILLGYFYSVK
jgi:hypothetical protein